MKLSVGNIIELTQRLAHSPSKDFKSVAGKDYVEKVFRTCIGEIEDRGEYLYIHHTPLNKVDGRFGCFRLYKNEQKQYGVVKVELIES